MYVHTLWFTLLFVFYSIVEIKMTCCPETAWGDLKNTNYVKKGVVESIPGLKLYRVGNSSKCIIWNYDVFGFDGGRTRQVADFLASHGYMVIIPDYFRGKMIAPMTSTREQMVQFMKNESQWEPNLRHDWEKKILPYAKKHGAKTFGTIGTCWGSYLVLRLSSYVEVKAGISMHPCHTGLSATLNIDETQLLKETKCPQMFLAAGDDHENVKSRGLGKKVLGDSLEVIEFPEMRHGWTTKGDLSKPEVERDVKKAINLALGFFGKHLK